MLLPPRPLQLRPSFVWKFGLGGAALALVGIAFAGYGAVETYTSARDLSEECRIWESGVQAQEASATAKVTKNKFSRSCKLDVRYVDANGVAHARRIEFSTIGRSIRQTTAPVVRYLPDDPDRFAVSWAVQAKTSRIVAIVVFALGGLLGGTSFAVFGIYAVRRHSLARRRALDSDEVIVRITQVEPKMGKGGHTGNIYHYAGKTTDGREVSGTESLPKDQEPLFADASERTMVVLVDPVDTGPALVVRRDFHPFVLTPEEQDAVRAAIGSR